MEKKNSRKIEKKNKKEMLIVWRDEECGGV